MWRIYGVLGVGLLVGGLDIAVENAWMAFGLVIMGLATLFMGLTQAEAK